MIETQENDGASKATEVRKVDKAMAIGIFTTFTALGALGAAVCGSGPVESLEIGLGVGTVVEGVGLYASHNAPNA